MRTLWVILVVVAAVYAVLLAYVYFFQSRLIYFPDNPGRELVETPAAIGLAFEDLHVTTADGVRLHGWFVSGAPGAPTVLYCHGNAGNISHRLDRLRIFNDLGLAVLLFDYRGYGRSEGSPSEQGTYRDARAVWEYLTSARHIPPARILIFGESLGGPIAAELARSVAPGALVLASTFTSAPDLASKFYGFLPVRLLARYQYPTARFVDAVRRPLLVIHSRDDEIVPFSQGEEIFRRGHDPKQFVEIFGDHNAGFLMSQSQVVAGLQKFLAAHFDRGVGTS